jgi:uncharacterized protein (TIGR03086 family)
MSQQGMPNTVELFESAAKESRRILAGVKEEQLGDSTPCSEWDVKALLSHMIDGANYGVSALSGAEPAKSDGSLQAYDAATSRLIELAKAPGNMERKIQFGAGEMTGGEAMAILFMDNFVHGWDLAKATNQDTRLDSRLTETVHTMFAPQMDMLRQSDRFGPEVKVPDDSNTQVKMLGMMGRRA